MQKKICIVYVFCMLFFLAGCGADETAQQDNWEPVWLYDVTEDQQGNGWYWDAEEKNLILDGLNVVWDARKVKGGTAFQLPDLAQIVLAEGSENRIHIRAKEDTIITAFSGMGTTYIDGTGRLDITGENLRVGLASTSDIEIHGGTISMQNETDRISSLFETKEQYVQYAGDITAKNTMVRAENGIVVHDGSLDAENFIEPFQVLDGDIVINGGKVNIRQSGEPETSNDAGIASNMISIYDDWVINGGEVFATGIRTNGRFTVNNGVVKVDGAGIDLQSDGRYEQYGGNVAIHSDKAGIYNIISQEYSNTVDKRIILEGGNLEIVSRSPEYGAVEMIMVSTFTKPLITDERLIKQCIYIGDKMSAEIGEWIIKPETAYPFIRQRDTMHEFSENDYCPDEYFMITMKDEFDALKEGQFDGMQKVIFKSY